MRPGPLGLPALVPIEDVGVCAAIIHGEAHLEVGGDGEEAGEVSGEREGTYAHQESEAESETFPAMNSSTPSYLFRCTMGRVTQWQEMLVLYSMMYTRFCILLRRDKLVPFDDCEIRAANQI